ncbi:MAG TPA: chemotaxis protein CheW [Nitrospiraceae bacterium]|nr:chemotaxis protein CheW [Nitrospiraceae bacterium]
MLGFPAEWIRGILTRKEAGSGQTVSSAGATYRLTSLVDRLRLPPRADSADTRIILYGNGICARAFLVDTVVELTDVDRRDLRPMPVHFRSAERTRLDGLLLYGSTVVLMVNPVWLLETDNRMDALESRMMLLQDEAQPPLRDPGVVIPDRELSVEHMK